MIRNYLALSFRNLSKNKGYSFINILGLAMGLAISFLIGLWIWDELAFDSSFQNHDRIAQVMTTTTSRGETRTGSAASIPLANELQAKFGGDFKYIALTSWSGSHILAQGENKISGSGIWAQADLARMLSLTFSSGSADALKDPTSILVSESMAHTLFGEAEAAGKVIRMDNMYEMKVAGIYKDFPHNSTFYRTDVILPWDKYITTEDWIKTALTLWRSHNFQLFVQLNDNARLDRTEAKIRTITQPHVPGPDKEEILLHPMDRWHLYSEFSNGKVAGGRIRFVWLFGTIGMFVLVLACINFMNLSTARSEKRAKEVGIRKTIGSTRSQLITQFLSESLVVAFLSFFLSIGIVLLALPGFNSLASKDIHFPWGNPFFWLVALLFTAFTGLIAGSYPAFYLSGFSAVKVLRGTFRAGRFSALPRKILVVLQFTVSIALIIGTIVVFRQINYTKDRPVGYSRAGLITVTINTPDILRRYDLLRSDLRQTGAVGNMALSSSPSTELLGMENGMNWQGKDPNTDPLFGMVSVTHDYGKTVGWKIVDGRDFSRDFGKYTTGALILNEAAVKLTGLKKPVGQVIDWQGFKCEVVGVVENMVMESPYTPVRPTMFFLNYKNAANVIMVRINPQLSMHEALTRIAPVFRSHDPGSPFDYKITDDEYSQKFSDEERIGRLATLFSVLAVFISCLGLFGLASFTAELRRKEIGIRKVLGASVLNVWRLLSVEFIMLVILSWVIAAPLAYEVLHQWLQRYEYHTSIGWWIFAAAGIITLCITLITVSFQAIKAALASSVKSIKAD